MCFSSGCDEPLLNKVHDDTTPCLCCSTCVLFSSVRINTVKRIKLSLFYSCKKNTREELNADLSYAVHKWHFIRVLGWKPPQTLALVWQFPWFYCQVGNILSIKGMCLDTMRNMFFCFSDVTVVIIYWDINNGYMATKPEVTITILSFCKHRTVILGFKIFELKSDISASRVRGSLE